MKRFKKIVVSAVNGGSISVNPFGNMKFSVKKQDPAFLTEAELDIIKNKSLCGRLAKVRDVFVFSAYTGLAYVDVCELKAEHVIPDSEGNLWIRKPRQKTKVVSTIPLLPIPAEILKKYSYQLPVSSNQKMNAYLKEIGTVCGIDKELHYHCSRHTAATLLLNRGTSLEVVSKVLGHSNTKQTQHYARMLDKTVFNEVFRAMGSSI
jgi:integrase